MIQAGESSTRVVEADRTDHALCGLTSALRLIAGREIRVPKRAYSGASPTRFARLLQIGNGARELLLSAGRQRTLVSGDQLEYRAGGIDYFAEGCFQRGWSHLRRARPFFVVPGADPGGAIAAGTGCDARPEPRLSLSANRCVVVMMANWKGTPAVLHYAGCGESIAELGRLQEGLALASSDAQISHLVARSLAHTRVAGSAMVSAQERISAEPYEFSWRRVDAAMERWLTGEPEGKDGTKVWVGQRLARVREFLPAHRDALMPGMDALLEWSETARIQGELAHGDFWLGNVLFKGGEVVGIVDWEWAQRDGLRVVDGLHMLLMSCAVAHEVPLAHYLCRFWDDEIDDAELEERISRLGAQHAMDRDDLKFVALLLWFGILWQKAVRGGVTALSWSEQMVPRTVPAIGRWLGRYTRAQEHGVARI